MHQRRVFYYVGIFVAVVVLTQTFSIRRAQALTFTVTTAADNGNNASPTAGSLRKAILDANANGGLDTIQFNIGGGGFQTIQPPAALPTITSPVIIDGYTQGGAVVNTGTTQINATINIALDGTSAGASVNGLLLGSGSSGSTIKGLRITNFSGHGIRLDSSSNKIQGCFLGLFGGGNASDGVIINNTDNNIIGTDGDGTSDLAEKNLILFNGASGVEIFGASATGNVVKGNFIGVSSNGTLDQGNAVDGIEIELALNNTIGGTTANERNIISGNDSDGVEIHGSGATGNVIQGNYIGTSTTGTADLGNTGNGVNINGVAGNTVGGVTSTPGTGTGNVISGNNSDGVEILGDTADNNTIQGNILGLNAAGTADLGNSGSGVFINDGDSNTIGGSITTARNVISGNGVQGVRLVSNADSNVIKGNFIGTNAAGTAAIGNSQGGILLLTDCSLNLIGGTLAAERNIISGNGQEGIELNDSGNNQVVNNYIGTDVNGNADLGNTTDGVLINNGQFNSIGITGTNGGNVISGNNTNGIEIINTAPPGEPLHVSNNIIGLNAAGTTALGNTSHGLLITDSNNVEIGSNSTSARNIISGNGGHGILILGTSTGILVQGNFIGTDITGTLDRGNSASGIIVDANGITIGGAGGARNIISGNNSFGVGLQNPAGTGNLLQNNFIGTDINGTGILNNSLGGVVISGSNNTIGGTAGLGNIIAFNSNDGVRILGSTSNAIFANSIFSNGNASGEIGIDLNDDGVTANDPLDADSGGNNLQNFPVLTSAIRNSGNNTTTILGSLDSTPDTTFTLQFFSSPSCDASGNGQGQTYLGSTTVHTTIDGSPTSFIIAFSTAVPIGNVITATATDPGRNTSEFSACRAVTGDSPTSVDFVGATLTGFTDGVLLEWQTSMEVNNLGFNLYRDDGGKLMPVNQQLIAGSALLIGSEIELRSGHTYQWWDSQTADKSTAYWVEDHDLKGESRWHGPFYIGSVSGERQAADSKIQQAKTLASLAVTDTPSRDVESRATLPASTGAVSPLQAMIAVLPPGNAVKLAIQQEGFYRLTQAELLAAGLNPSLDPRDLQLFVDGVQQAITVNGEEDGRFDATDTVEFYGQGIDSPYSTTRTYYLVAGAKAGNRITRLDSPAPAVSDGSFANTVERRDRSIYFSALRNGDRENFFGSVLATQPVNQTLTLRHLNTASARAASLKIGLQGVTEAAHSVVVQINGQPLSQIQFYGQSYVEYPFSLSHSMLREGENVVTFSTTGSPTDVSLIDFLRLTAQHTFTADDDVLRFTLTDNQAVTIGGFSSPDIQLFEVTDATAVRAVNGQISKQESDARTAGNFRVSFLPQGIGERHYLALTKDRARHVASLKADVPSNWRDFAGADFVIITHSDFREQAETLKKYRQQQGLVTVVVDIEDLYDEFSFGQKTPQALRQFLAAARTTWSKPVQYALFLGDASYDPKDYLRLGNSDFVPTKLVDTQFLETASDDWLADFNNNKIADFAIGRLPARTAADASLMVNKIISYESAGAANEALLVSDINDGYNFEQASAELVPYLPQGIQVTQLKRSQLGDPQTRVAVLAAINRGQRVVNYAGHGSVSLWRGGTFGTTDVSALTNREHLAVFVMMNCLNGYFVEPTTESLAESLLRSTEGGAVAAWASSALTFANGQAAMNKEFYRQIFSNRARLGDAALRAKAVTYDEDIRRTWILMGDPTLRVK